MNKDNNSFFTIYWDTPFLLVYVHSHCQIHSQNFLLCRSCGSSTHAAVTSFKIIYCTIEDSPATLNMTSRKKTLFTRHIYHKWQLLSHFYWTNIPKKAHPLYLITRIKCKGGFSKSLTNFIFSNWEESRECYSR